jgi:hypothetical protein
MSSSTINPSRETSNQFNTEEHVLGAISKEVCIFLIVFI